MNTLFLISKTYRRGVTIVELLVVVAVFSVLMIVLVNFFVGYNNSFTYLTTSIDASQSTGLFINSASNAVRQAKQIVTSHVFSGTTYTTSATALVLELPSINASGVVSGAYDYMTFYLSGTDIYWRTDANASSTRTSFTKKISTSVQSLAFTYNNGDVTQATKVDIAITVQKQVQNQTIQSSLHQQIYLRNK